MSTLCHGKFINVLKGVHRMWSMSTVAPPLVRKAPKPHLHIFANTSRKCFYLSVPVSVSFMMEATVAPLLTPHPLFHDTQTIRTPSHLTSSTSKSIQDVWCARGASFKCEEIGVFQQRRSSVFKTRQWGPHRRNGSSPLAYCWSGETWCIFLLLHKDTSGRGVKGGADRQLAGNK